MLRGLRQIKNLHCYYCVLRGDSSKICCLSFPRVCSVRNEFLHSVSNQNNLSLISFLPSLQNVRNKSKGKGKNYSQEDSDDEFSDDEEVFKEDQYDENGGKMRVMKVRALRLDHILKSGFGLTRRRTDECVLSKKVHINGRSVSKKSMEVAVRDEIELFKSSTEGGIESARLSKIIIKKIEPIEDSSMYYVYISDYKS